MMTGEHGLYTGSRKIIVSFGVGLAVVAGLADWIGIGSAAPGFGKTQFILLLFGGVLVSAATLVPDPLLVRVVLRPFLVIASAYVAFLTCEIVLCAVLPQLKSPAWALRGRFVEDEKTGYRLAPNYHGYYDDGAVRAEYRTNSLGDRDDEPGSHDGPRVLLIGDSFTYGHTLDQSETIDKHIEKATAGAVDAYNLGVSGYGPPAILEHFRSSDWFRGTDVVYLFFSNDLRDDNLVPDSGYTVFDGDLVPKYKAEDVRFTEDEYRIKIAGLEQTRRAPTLGRAARSLLNLTSVRKVIQNALKGLGDSRDLELRLLWFEGLPQKPFPWQLWQYSPENVDRAIAYTEAMQGLATERMMDFHVVLVPTKEEARHRHHAKLVELYGRKLAERGIHVIGLLDRLALDDYFRHDAHFNASGASRAAAAIIEGIGR